MELLAEQRDSDARFRAALHGHNLPDREGRVVGLRQQQMARMRARMRGGPR